MPNISQDVPCKICQYNLRTLAPSANCPECNTPVAESLHVYYSSRVLAASARFFRGLHLCLLALLLFLPEPAVRLGTLRAGTSLHPILPALAAALEFAAPWLLLLGLHQIDSSLSHRFGFRFRYRALLLPIATAAAILHTLSGALRIFAWFNLISLNLGALLVFNNLYYLGVILLFLVSFLLIHAIITRIHRPSLNTLAALAYLLVALLELTANLIPLKIVTSLLDIPLPTAHKIAFASSLAAATLLAMLLFYLAQTLRQSLARPHFTP